MPVRASSSRAASTNTGLSAVGQRAVGDAAAQQPARPRAPSNGGVAQRELGSLLTRRDECGRYGPDSANTLHDAATTLPKSMGSYPMPRRHAREVQPADTRAYEHGAAPPPPVDARETPRRRRSHGAPARQVHAFAAPNVAMMWKASRIPANSPAPSAPRFSASVPSPAPLSDRHVQHHRRRPDRLRHASAAQAEETPTRRLSSDLLVYALIAALVGGAGCSAAPSCSRPATTSATGWAWPAG